MPSLLEMTFVGSVMATEFVLHWRVATGLLAHISRGLLLKSLESFDLSGLACSARRGNKTKPAFIASVPRLLLPCKRLGRGPIRPSKHQPPFLAQQQLANSLWATVPNGLHRPPQDRHWLWCKHECSSCDSRQHWT